MFGRRYRLFRIAGIDIGIDLSWAILFLLITWSLARGLFPVTYAGLPGPVYWWMGIAGALGLFASILLHELSHALVARRNGIPVRAITLFVFGGVAELSQDPPNAWAELRMAIVGPLASVVLGAALWGVAELGDRAGWSIPVVAVLGYLAWINVVVAIFNMLPAFPLDGGRVLRAILWRMRGNLRWATRITSALGSAFGLLLAGLGVVLVLTGDFVSGIWYVIIGMFLRMIAQTAYRDVLMRSALAGALVRRFMRPDPITIPAALTLAEAVDRYVYRFDHKLFPVVADGRLTGCLTTAQLRAVPREDWPVRRVGEIAAGCAPESTIAPDVDVARALQQMSRTRISRLMVVEDGRLVGIITLKDLLHYVTARIELEGEDLAELPAARIAAR